MSVSDSASAALSRLFPRKTGSAVHVLQTILYCCSLFAVALADRNALWVDEQITRELVQRWTAWELLTVLPQHQPHFPTYYFIPELAGWQATQYVSLISLPVTAYAVSQAANSIYGDETAGVLAAGLIAASPYLAVQASWIRMYAPLTAVLTVGFWWGLDGQYRQAAAAMLAAALLHPFGAFGGIWLAVNHLRRQHWWTGLVALTASVTPALVLVLVDTAGRGISTRTTGMGHGIEPGLLEFALTPVAALAGSPHSILQVTGVLLVTGLLVYPRGDTRVLAWILLPVVGITVTSVVVHPVFRLKYFGIIAPGVALLAADPRRGRWPRRAVVVTLLVLMGVTWLQRLVPIIVTRRFIFWF